MSCSRFFSLCRLAILILEVRLWSQFIRIGIHGDKYAGIEKEEVFYEEPTAGLMELLEDKSYTEAGGESVRFHMVNKSNRAWTIDAFSCVF